MNNPKTNTVALLVGFAFLIVCALVFVKVVTVTEAGTLLGFFSAIAVAILSALSKDHDSK